jgi:regulation of enolase protein 1 (concanavalin A-like superfamily)
VAVTPANGINFQSGFNQSAAGPAIAPPNAWVKLTRVGNTITSSTSADGQTWTDVGSATVNLSGSAVIGMFVSSHDGSKLGTAAFDNISVTKSAAAPGALPTPWTATDIGAPNLSGSSSYSAGTFTVNGAGTDIWGNADQFQFVNQTLTGDGQIIARVTAQQTTTNGWAKAGVMIKQSPTAGSPYALVAVTPANGINFQSGFNQNVQGPATAPPNTWLKLTRTGNTITSFWSADGQTWTQVGTATVALTNALIGLFVTSHNGAQLNTSVFDNVTVVSQVNPIVA